MSMFSKCAGEPNAPICQNCHRFLAPSSGDNQSWIAGVAFLHGTEGWVCNDFIEWRKNP